MITFINAISPNILRYNNIRFECAPASITEIINSLQNQHNQSYIGHENVAKIFSD